ncbi:MAG: peroxiredoxin [Synechococcaceae cyanobacterium]|nr:peroxiredoxin [Synechococcaceae cyanobacterium]
MFPRRARALGGVLPALDQPAPGFDLAAVVPDNRGQPVVAQRNLSDFAGRWLVLYFYPRDFTGGCTLEARGFQRDLGSFDRLGAEVAGISADDGDSHQSFCGSEGLAFPLLSDTDGAVSRRYGSWMAPYSLRHTFLIDPQGMLRQIWTAVRPAGHSAEVLAALEQMLASATPAAATAQR